MAVRGIEISNQYIYFYLKSLYNFFQRSGVGIAIPGLSREQINNLIFSLPPLAEQQRIVEQVEALLTLCDAVQAGLVAAEEARQRLLGSLLQRVGVGPG
jgi:type I restriction enzyme S subunit